MPAKQGRWPDPAETGAIVITRMVQNQMPGLRVGGELLLKFRERSTKVRVVGLVDEVATPMIYASFPTHEAVTGLGDGSTNLRLKTAQPGSVVPAIDGALFDARIPVSQIQTRADRREVLDDHFQVVTTVVKMIALAAALVGAICLAAFACLNVLERAREVGVIRTLGATPRTVTALFLAESGAIALLSLALVVGLSLAATRALNDLTSRELLQVAVPLIVSRTGLALLGGGLAAVMLGVWLPVARLLRMSVRDALAYE
jgi:putative ABC transport system permease protein